LSISNQQSIQLMRCLGSDNDVELTVFEKNLKIENAINGTNLKKLEKEIGEINTITAVCYLLTRFNSNFNFGRSLTDAQAALLASDIVEKYPYETIEDVVLMLKQVRQGIIGDGKDYKLDGQNVLTKWFPEYLEKKYIEFERIKKQEQSISKEELLLKTNAINAFYEKRKQKVAEKENYKKTIEEIDKMVEFMDRQMLEDTILDWEKKPEMSVYMDYLRKKRLVVKGIYTP